MYLAKSKKLNMKDIKNKQIQNEESVLEFSSEYIPYATFFVFPTILSNIEKNP